MTAPVRPMPAAPDAQGVPHLPRILSPDEYDQSQNLTVRGLGNANFPTVPAPVVNPTNPPPGVPAMAPKESTRIGSDPNPNPQQMTGLGRILTKYVAQPIMDHPLATAASALVPGAGLVMSGLMAKDLAEYAGQKAAEMTMDPDSRKIAEADPNRIPGERAAVEAGMMLGAPLLHSGVKAAGDALKVADSPLAMAVKQHGTDIADSFRTIFAPASRSPQAAEAAGILRATTGDMAARYEQSAFKLDEFRRAAEQLPESDRLGFIDAIEGGRSQASPEFQEAADTIREILDTHRQAIQDLGTGKLEHFIQDYFPHIWEDPDRAANAFKSAAEQEPGAPSEPGTAVAPASGASPGALAAAKIATGGKRPMEGSKAFLKQRTIPTTLEGMQMGLTPVSTNPVDLTLLKLREMQRYLMAHQSLNEMKDAGLVKFVKAGELAPDGYSRIDDKIATVFGKPTVGISEAFDAEQRTGIQNAIDQLGGVKVTRPTKITDQPGMPAAGVLGYARGDSEIAAKFGTHDGVLMHELGHIVDNRYGMGAKLAAIPNGQAELSALADLRAGSNQNVTPEMASYLHDPKEQAANALHAYLHAPERMKEVAPNVYAALDKFLQSDPKLAAIRDIKPSVALGTSEREVPVGGMVIRGQYHAPEEVAKVVNNYLSPGLRGNAIYDAYRGLGNTLNQAQLGLSAFHLGFTSMDASVSRAALGLEYLGSGKPIEGLKEVASAPVAPITNMMLGRRIRQAYLNPDGASPDMLALANAVKEAGGRVRQDSFYQNSAPERMIEAWKQGEYGKATALSLPALFETAAKPIMEHVVPMQKLGVFGDLAKKVLSELPPEATLAERRAALGSAWDSVDNRMGQLVYDNLFWNKTVKDLAMASVRSVGWNIGTIRELGGGMSDLADAAAGSQQALTHRAAYVMALPLTVGLYGAAYQYLRTGEGPSELKDYFYPKTGETDPDGNPERVQLASYMKDFFAYAGDPWGTVKHKESPILSSVYQMLQNEDYYGDEIRNPDDPAVKQIAQEAKYMGEQLLPFSIRNMQEQSKRGDQSTATKVGNWFGITPAPRKEVRSDAQNRMAEYQAEDRTVGTTPEVADARKTRSEILGAMRAGGGDDLQQKVTDAIERHQLTSDDVVKLLKRAGTTPAVEKFKGLTLPQAIDVFKRATPDEQGKFAEALINKVSRAKKIQAIDSGPTVP